MACQQWLFPLHWLYFWALSKCKFRSNKTFNTSKECTSVLQIHFIQFLFLSWIFCIFPQRSLSADRHKIHMNLVLSLLLAQVLFLAGIRETSNQVSLSDNCFHPLSFPWMTSWVRTTFTYIPCFSQVVCKIIAVFMHYFYLTAFTWMLVEGLHLYLKVVQVFKTENVKILYYYIFGWGKQSFLASDIIKEKIVHNVILGHCFIELTFGPIILIFWVNLLFIGIVRAASTGCAKKGGVH